MQSYSRYQKDLEHLNVIGLFIMLSFWQFMIIVGKR